MSVAATQARLAGFAAAIACAGRGKPQLRVIDKHARGIVANRYMPEFPHPKQLAALVAGEGHDDKTGPFEMLFGGAAGGGKSSWLLQAVAMRAARWPHYRAVILRRSYAEMIKAGAIMSRALKQWLPLGVAWNGSAHRFTFPSGATCEFAYHGHVRDDAQFQSAEWHDALFDELTHWPEPDAFDWLSTRLRTASHDPIVRRLLATSNPGGPGHTWVKDRFVGGQDIATGKRFEARSFYLPSKISDNPSLDREAYIATLQKIHPTRRAQLLDGDWSAREPGDYFRLEWFGPLLDDYEELGPRVRVRWWDLAASEKETAARTAGVLMSRLQAGARVVEHATAFRATPGKRDGKIAAQAKIDGYATVVGLEIEGGSGGPAQFEALSKRLRAEGFRVVGARPRATGPKHSELEAASMSINTPSDKAKEARADPVASCLERGYQRRGECDDSGEPWWGVDQGEGVTSQRDGIRLVAGPWTQGYLDELEGFSEATLKDLVDATTGAWAYLENHAFGQRRPPAREEKKRSAYVSHNDHPDDRPEDASETDAAGHWRP